MLSTAISDVKELLEKLCLFQRCRPASGVTGCIILEAALHRHLRATCKGKAVCFLSSQLERRAS